MKISSYKINLAFLLLFSLFLLSSCGNFKVVTINDVNKNKSENATLKNKVETSTQKSTANSKTEKYKEFEVKAEQVVEAARKQLGTPHLDQNPQKKPAVDCSGMTCKSYSTVGVNLPRTTTGQAETGKFVPKKDLQKGDLVFFASKKGHTGISHVGLVSRVEEGKTFFIHTSTSRGVVEDDFYMEHWQNVFVTARRIL
jgi:cell wall-associated NlpC family hydrolase